MAAKWTKALAVWLMASRLRFALIWATAYSLVTVLLGAALTGAFEKDLGAVMIARFVVSFPLWCLFFPYFNAANDRHRNPEP